MRAAVYDRYGPVDVLSVRDFPAPRPGRGEVLVRVRAAALNPKDIFFRKGRYRLITGFRFPQRVGFDFAGEVAQAAHGYAAGARVYGMRDGVTGGSCAGEVAVPAAKLAPMPERATFEEAAAIPVAGQTALQSLVNLASVQAGSTVCINGAAGGVGVFGVQIAKILGARVVALASPRNHAFLRELGADETHDYNGWSPPESAFDVFFDVFGNRAFVDIAPALREPGTYVQTVASARTVWDIARTSFARKRARAVVVRSRAADLRTLAAWVDEGRLRPIVSHVFPLDDIRAAEAQIETKHTRGKVVVQIS